MWQPSPRHPCMHGGRELPSLPWLPTLTRGSTPSAPPCPVRAPARTGCTGRPHSATSCLAGCSRGGCKSGRSNHHETCGRSRCARRRQQGAGGTRALAGSRQAASSPGRALRAVAALGLAEGPSLGGSNQGDEGRHWVQVLARLQCCLRQSAAACFDGKQAALTWHWGQVSTPGSLLAVPSGQSTHESWPDVGTVPGPHSWHFSCPAGAKSGQPSQESKHFSPAAHSETSLSAELRLQALPAYQRQHAAS